MSNEYKAAYTVREFCEKYSISPAHTYRLFKAGEISARKTGRRTLITHEEAERWLRSLREGHVPQRPTQLAQNRHAG